MCLAVNVLCIVVSPFSVGLLYDVTVIDPNRTFLYVDVCERERERERKRADFYHHSIKGIRPHPVFKL